MASPSGRIDGDVHHFPVRVYYEDTDASGDAYHASYLRFAERARTECLRLLGAGGAGRAAGGGWVVRRCSVEYLRPARLDDELDVCTRIRALGGASADLEQIVQRRGVDLARLDLHLAFITPKGRPGRLPAPLRAALESVVQPQPGA